MRLALVFFAACATTQPSRPSDAHAAQAEETATREERGETAETSAPTNTVDTPTTNTADVAWLPHRHQAPRGDLIEAGGSAWIVDENVHRLTERGPELDERASQALERILRPAFARDETGEWAVHGGPRLTISIGDRTRARTQRLGARRPLRIQDGVQEIVHVESGEEVWILQDSNGARIALRSGEGRFSFPSLPLPVGPLVPGLSTAGHAICSAPIPHRAASNGAAAAVLVISCHRDADLVIVTRSDGQWSTRSLPAPGFGVEAFALTPDGRAVVAGAPGKVAEEENGQWRVRTLASRVVTVSHLALDSGGATWVAGLSSGGGIDDGSDAWLLFRNEAVVPLRSPNGDLVHVTGVVSTRDRGIVASTFVRSGGRWVFTAR
ncbi:MAG: hypothetical protein AAGE52_36125 [Myxococcota bacterium]